MRDVEPSTIKRLEELSREFHLKTITATVQKLIDKHKGDMEHTHQLSKRNTELHRKLAGYVAREANQTATLMKFLNNLDLYKRETKSNLSDFKKRTK
jgi:hypothetical protein